jgi:hypothetical protein
LIMAIDREALMSAALKLAEAPPPEAPPAADAAAPAEPELADSDGKLEPADEPEKPAAPALAIKADKVTKTLEDVAREKSALRAERAALAKDKDRAARAEALLEAAEKGDAMRLLTAAKIPWNAAAKQVLEGVPDKAPAPAGEPSAAERRIEALERELAQNKAQANRIAVLTKVHDQAKSDPKFKFVAGLDASERALQYLERFHAETGELPGQTLDESIELALEAVENQLSREADRWRPLLGSGATSAPAAKPAVSKVAVSQQAPKTLTNDTGSGPKPAPGNTRAPKTEDEYRADALKLMESYPAE